MISYSLIRFCHKDIPNEGFNPQAVLIAKLCIIIPYSIIFLGFFVHATMEFSQIQNEIKIKDLIKIKADPFLENLFKEINNIPPAAIIRNVIILFCASFCTHVLAWNLSIIFTKRYMKLLKNIGKN